VNAARLTSESGSLSWRTPTEAETHNQDYSSQTYLQNQVQPNWPTANARDWKDSGPTQGNRVNPNLGTAVARWPTPNAQVSQDGESPETWLKRKEAMKAKGYNGNGCGTPLTIAVQLHGQADPASSNTSGSRQGFAMRLNPRWVEVLQGLPIGWTMPSCTSPQTIAPMSCDFSATELCQPPQSELSEFSLAS
jgi:hypothetical protein